MCFREPAQRWQPAPGSKAAMLVKVSSTGRNHHAPPVSVRSLHRLSPPTSGSSSPVSTHSRNPSLGRMAVPGDPKQPFHFLKKADNGNFLVMPGSCTSLMRPSSPQYASTAPVPIYDEPPRADPPIYDEPPLDMEVEGAKVFVRDAYKSSHSMSRVASPPKLLQFPHAKHKRYPSAGEYSAAGRECIKHMVNVEQQSASSPKETGSIEKKQPWHSRQSSLASQEYAAVATVTYQDSGYSTGPSPSVCRKNRRRPVPGCVMGSGGELSDKLMAEMKVALRGSEGSLRCATLPGNKAGSGVQGVGSEHSIYSRHADTPAVPTDGLAGRQKRTYEKVDSLEKSVTSQTSLSSPEPPTSPSQVRTFRLLLFLLDPFFL